MEKIKEQLVKLLKSAHFVYLHKLAGAEMWSEIAGYLISKDVVPVVRCVDCKHSRFHYADGYTYCVHDSSPFDIVQDNDFCSYGERKDNERKAD